MNTLALFPPHHSLVLDLGRPGPGERADIVMQRRPKDPGCGPGVVTEVIIGTYSIDVPEAAQISDTTVAAKFPMTALVHPLVPAKGIFQP